MERLWHPPLVKGVVQCLRDTSVGGYYADKCLERLFKQNKKWGSRDRRFIAETVYNMIRWWSLLAFFDEGEMEPPTEEAFLLRWAFYEVWQNNQNPLEFLHEQFNFASELTPNEMQARVNVVPSEPWLQAAFPPWLYERFHEQFGEETLSLLKSLNDPAPVCLRVNTLKTNREALQQKLEIEDIETDFSQTSPTCLTLKKRQNVFTSLAFKEGLFEVQDEASQKVAPLLNPKPGERIGDLCAGAGGKTLHLAALMQNKGTLLACDISERKLEELKIRARRSGVSNLRIQIIEGTKFIKRQAGLFDAILIDAPCSGTGVIRRNPDTKWKLSPEELTRLRGIQAQILQDYSKLVCSGGRLVYATCSLLKEENEDQIELFLKANEAFKKDGESLIIRPDKDGQDGFFAQRMVRI